MSASGELLFVVGLEREARLLGPSRRVAVGPAAVAQALYERPAGVVSFGLCGALDLGLAVGDLVLATAVVWQEEHLDTDESLLQRLVRHLGPVARGPIAGSDVIVGSAQAKAALRASCGAIAVDMESHAVARAAQAAGVPFAVLRAVSDGAEDDLPLAAQAGFRPDGRADVAAVIRALARHPHELPALLRTARHAGAAFNALRAAAAAF